MPDFLANEPGWVGMFTRAHADGALANGTRVTKVNSEPGDTRPDGVPGVVLGSISHPEVMDGIMLYFIEWADAPRQAVGTVGFKVEAQR
jgi:hypothetical protein